MEMSYGDWEGMTATDVALHDRAAHGLRYQDRLNHRVPNGESYLDMYHRAASWLAGITLGQVTVVVAHSAFNRMLMRLPAVTIPNSTSTRRRPRTPSMP